MRQNLIAAVVGSRVRYQQGEEHREVGYDQLQNNRNNRTARPCLSYSQPFVERETQQTTHSENERWDIRACIQSLGCQFNLCTQREKDRSTHLSRNDHL